MRTLRVHGLKMKLCEKCGVEIPGEAQLCAHCSAPVVDRTTQIAASYCVGAVGFAFGAYLEFAGWGLLAKVEGRPKAPGLVLVVQNHGVHYYLTPSEYALYQRQSLYGILLWGMGMIGLGLVQRFKGIGPDSQETALWRKKKGRWRSKS